MNSDEAQIKLRQQIENFTQTVLQVDLHEISLSLQATENEVVLSGNKDGLLYLSSILLSLAAQASEGQHYHFDENTTFDRCDRDFIVAYRKVAGS
jgi:hypothetical protein